MQPKVLNPPPFRRASEQPSELVEADPPWILRLKSRICRCKSVPLTVEVGPDRYSTQSHEQESDANNFM
jgi:hypothetical protein